ncbi:DUF3369 domain-containing protein [Pleionea sp. CnH1-48]|uniref:DUF3369 domain-containing protein n=1 Tax=Pleionea sp. CnH1-48 TaxID=2954494 RepID=UPI00209776D7|nr:DUF3369 domain-containing protein [Pleionea sp. CnH1-48]MCO7223365.1 DUF3369 domain-containing protein [Pleionea sp. CnH1-48]
MTLDDELVFADESDDTQQDENELWDILIVDDDPEVHQVTRLALKYFEFSGKLLNIASAYSAKEAQEMLSKQKFAVILLDVVMETDHAGLELARWIRNDNNDTHVRIVLRTGQPGQAPEREVIAKYDINDYKEKTELTSNKLFTLMYSCLRSYRDIIALHRNKLGLETIIKGTDKIFAHHSLQEFTQGALEQLSALLQANEGAFYGKIEGIAATYDKQNSTILAGTGRFDQHISRKLEEVIDSDKERIVQETISKGGEHFADDYFIGVYHSHLNRKNILYLDGLPPLSELDRHLLQIFCTHIGVAFDNVSMIEEIELTQREIVYRMSEAVESRSKETSNHVKRVAWICKTLAQDIQLNDRDVDVLYMASPLHDIGKIAIPDHILNKPGPLDDEEWKVMQKHAQIGHDILANSQLEVLRAGAKIAGDHHEKWDGSGYPNNKKEEDIHLFARITAIADVFDALYNRRCYKEPWHIDKIINLFQEQKGKHFDPKLVERLVARLSDIVAIQEKYPD